MRFGLYFFAFAFLHGSFFRMQRGRCPVDGRPVFSTLGCARSARAAAAASSLSLWRSRATAPTPASASRSRPVPGAHQHRFTARPLRAPLPAPHRVPAGRRYREQAGPPAQGTSAQQATCAPDRAHISGDLRAAACARQGRGSRSCCCCCYSRCRKQSRTGPDSYQHTSSIRGDRC